jgi:ATP-dependent Lhr-like helicase
VNQLPDKPRCPRCGSNAIGLLKAEEEKVLPMIEKRGEKLTQSEEKLQKQASQTAQLIAKYGKVAAVGLCGKRLYSPDVAEILTKEPKLTNRFYELVLEAERKAMSKRFG